MHALLDTPRSCACKGMAALHALAVMAMAMAMLMRIALMWIENRTQGSVTVRMICARSLFGFKPNRNLIKKKDLPLTGYMRATLSRP